MTHNSAQDRPIIAAGVVLWHEAKVLLIRRGQDPGKGEWSIPGGRQKTGETVRACALRELREETGLEAELIDLIDVVDARYQIEGRVYQLTLVDFAARLVGGALRSGDDAVEARWFSEDELAPLNLWSETLRVIRAARTMAGS